MAEKDNNQEKIKTLEEKLKEAYSSDKFTEVKSLAAELKGLDPKNHVAERLLQRVQEKEQEANRKVHATEINKLQDDAQNAFKKGDFQAMERICQSLLKLDSDNSVVKKVRAKVTEAKAALEKKKREAALPKKPGLFARLNAWLKKRKEAKVAQAKLQVKPVPQKAPTSPVVQPKVTVSAPVSKTVVTPPAPAPAVVPVGARPAPALKVAPPPPPAPVPMVTPLAPKPAAPAPKTPEPKKSLFSFLASKVDQKPAIQPIPKAPAPAVLHPPAPKVATPKGSPVPVVPAAKVVSPVVSLSAKPVAAPSSAISKPITPPPAPPSAAKVSPAVTKPLPKEGEGNLFTRMFGQKEEAVPVPQAKSIIDTIVSKTEKTAKPVKVEKKKDTTGVMFLRFSNAFFQFAMVFVIISAAFFYIENKDIENRVLSLVKKESYASRLHNANTALEAKQEEIRTLDRDVKRFEEGYNNRYEEVIKQIVEKRLNWPDILQKINEITDTIYERNALSQYILYTSFTFDAEKGLIRVSGTLTDPLGKNLTKLAELEQAFRTYPRNPNDPNDKTEPYFYDFQEFSSLRKSLDKKTNKYTSSFQLSFALKPQVKP